VEFPLGNQPYEGGLWTPGRETGVEETLVAAILAAAFIQASCQLVPLGVVDGHMEAPAVRVGVSTLAPWG